MKFERVNGGIWRLTLNDEDIGSTLREQIKDAVAKRRNMFKEIEPREEDILSFRDMVVAARDTLMMYADKTDDGEFRGLVRNVMDFFETDNNALLMEEYDVIFEFSGDEMKRPEFRRLAHLYTDLALKLFPVEEYDPHIKFILNEIFRYEAFKEDAEPRFVVNPDYVYDGRNTPLVSLSALVGITVTNGKYNLLIKGYSELLDEYTAVHLDGDEYLVYDLMSPRNKIFVVNHKSNLIAVDGVIVIDDGEVRRLKEGSVFEYKDSTKVPWVTLATL